MNNSFFYFPLLYSFTTRLNNNKKRIAWFFSYVVPVFIAFHMFIPIKNIYLFVLSFIISIIVVYTVYEAGYIYNDAEVIKKESNPTLRLSNPQVIYYENNKFKIYGARLFFAILFVFFLMGYDAALAISLVISIVVISIVYIFYNSIRNKWNILFYSVLVFVRYFGVLVPFCSFNELFFLWTIYPLCVTIEFLSKPRFGYFFNIISENVDVFRVFYYFFYLFLFSLFTKDVSIKIDFLFFIFYFLSFRSVSYCFLAKRYRGINK